MTASVALGLVMVGAAALAMVVAAAVLVVSLHGCGAEPMLEQGTYDVGMSALHGEGNTSDVWYVEGGHQFYTVTRRGGVTFTVELSDTGVLTGEYMGETLVRMEPHGRSFGGSFGAWEIEGVRRSGDI